MGPNLSEEGPSIQRNYSKSLPPPTKTKKTDTASKIENTVQKLLKSLDLSKSSGRFRSPSRVSSKTPNNTGEMKSELAANKHMFHEPDEVTMSQSFKEDFDHILELDEKEQLSALKRLKTTIDHFYEFFHSESYSGKDRTEADLLSYAKLVVPIQQKVREKIKELIPIVEESDVEQELENLDLIAGLEEIPQKTLREDFDEGIEDYRELLSLLPLTGRAEVLQPATAESSPLVDRSKKPQVDLQKGKEQLQSTATSVEEAVDNFEELVGPPPPQLTEEYPVLHLEERVQKVHSEKLQSIGAKIRSAAKKVWNLFMQKFSRETITSSFNRWLKNPDGKFKQELLDDPEKMQKIFDHIDKTRKRLKSHSFLQDNKILRDKVIPQLKQEAKTAMLKHYTDQAAKTDNPEELSRIESKIDSSWFEQSDVEDIIRLLSSKNADNLNDLIESIKEKLYKSPNIIKDDFISNTEHLKSAMDEIQKMTQEFEMNHFLTKTQKQVLNQSILQDVQEAVVNSFSDQISKTTNPESLNHIQKQIILLKDENWFQKADKLLLNISRKKYITEDELTENKGYSYVAPYFLSEPSGTAAAVPTTAQNLLDPASLSSEIIKADDAATKQLTESLSSTLLAEDLNLYEKLRIEDFAPKEAVGSYAEIVQRFRMLSGNIVPKSILQGKSPEQRAKITAFYINAAKQLAAKADFNSAYAIYLGLNGVAISRLKLTFNKLNEKSLNDFYDLKDLFDPGHNNKALTKAMQQKEGDKKNVVLPPISILMKHMTALKETESEFLDQGVRKINPQFLSGLKKIFGTLENAQARIFQSDQPELSSPTYLDFKTNLSEQELNAELKTNEDQFYETSLKLEPREKTQEAPSLPERPPKTEAEATPETKTSRLEEALKREPPPPPKKDKGKEKVE